MKTHSEIVVKKFGGTSLGSIERIENVADRILEAKNNGESPVVVASAMSGETNRLVKMAHDVDPLNRGMAYDMLLASGEQVSISLLSMALSKRGLNAMPLLAYQLGIQTDAIYSKAKIKNVNDERLKSLISQGIIPVVAGFQGVSKDRITTLGRGGSDTTAVAIAAALKSNVCEIYTDVPAVFSADPRLVSEASEIPQLSFEEMMEMASLGSKVLHFRCVELAAKYNVKIHVRSSFERREGTWVVPEESNMENPVVSSVTHDPSTAVFKVFPVPRGPGFLADLFTKLSEKSVVVDIITQSYNEEGQRLAFSVPEEDVAVALETLKTCIDVDPVVMRNMAKISIIGVGMKNHQGVAARFFKVFQESEIEPHLVTTSDIKVSAVIEKEKLEIVAKALHTEFGLNK